MERLLTTQKRAKTFKNCVEKKKKKIAQLLNISTGGAAAATIFFHLWPGAPFDTSFWYQHVPNGARCDRVAHATQVCLAPYPPQLEPPP